jgi:hypothetical protein
VKQTEKKKNVFSPLSLYCRFNSLIFLKVVFIFCLYLPRSTDEPEILSRVQSEAPLRSLPSPDTVPHAASILTIKNDTSNFILPTPDSVF